MKKILLSLSLVVVLMVGLVATTPVKVALADCAPDGTAGDDTIVCDTTTETGDPGTDSTTDENGINTGTGTDEVTIEPGATVVCDTSAGDNPVHLEEDGTVVNYGSVVGCDDGSFFYTGIYIEEDGTIVNYGYVEGEWNGVATDGDGLIVNEGDIFANNNDGVWVYGDGAVFNSGLIEGDGNGVIVYGDGAVFNDGAIFGDNGNGILVYGDGAVFNSGWIEGDDEGVYVDESAFVYNSGYIGGVVGVVVDEDSAVVNDGWIEGVSSDGYAAGVVIVGPGTIENNGVIYATAPDGFAVGTDLYIGPFDVTNNGAIVAEGELSIGIWTDAQTDIVRLNDGSLTAGGNASVATWSGNDTVIVGSAGVSYGTSCGDIPTTLVQQSQNAPIVSGTMFGSSGDDTLIFNYFTPDAAEYDAFAAGFSNAAADFAPETTVIDWNGQSYEFYGFENVVLGGVFAEGPARLFDDGVVLAFATTHAASGIDVCSGPNGWRVGTIDFELMKAGQMTFSAGNAGWYLTLTSLGGNFYQVNVFDGGGVLQHDDFTFDLELVGVGGGDGGGGVSAGRGRGGVAEPVR